MYKFKYILISVCFGLLWEKASNFMLKDSHVEYFYCQNQAYLTQTVSKTAATLHFVIFYSLTSRDTDEFLIWIIK